MSTKTINPGTREIVQNVIDAFDNNDVEAILSQVTDDIVWNMVGEEAVSGKDGIRRMFASNPDIKMIASSTDHIIIDGDRAAVDGIVQLKDKNGEVSEMHYCDIYEIYGGKVRKMISYTVNKKK